MSAEEDAANAHRTRPAHQGEPEDDVNGGDQGEEGGEHHGSGGVARGETELVHQLDRGVLVINIVAGAAAASEGFKDGDHHDVEDEGEQEVEEERTPESVKTSDGDKQPRDSMTGYLKKYQIISL